MTIGMLLPSLLAAERFSERIFAPKPLFLDLADRLVARGHRVFVYSAPGTKTSGALVSGNELLASRDVVSVRLRDMEDEMRKNVSFRLTSVEYEIELTSRAFAHAAENGVEVMHSYHDFLAHYFGRVASVPVVYTLHDPVYPEDSLEGFRYRHFPHDNYVAISDSQRRLYEAAGINIIDRVYHGIELQQFPFGEKQGEYLAFMGRLVPEKGVEDAVAAAEQTKVALHIATSPNYLTTPYAKELQGKTFNGNNFVTLAGFLEGDTRNNWYAAAKAFLLPIHWEEPFGMVVIEAMACGTPVIAYNRGSIPELVADGVTGFVVDPDDADRQGKGSWVIKKQGIEGIVEAVSKIGEIDRAACRRHVEEHFSASKTAEGYEAAYQKVLQK